MHRAAYAHEVGRTPYVWLGRWERYTGDLIAPFFPLDLKLSEDKRTDDLVLTVGQSSLRVSSCVQLDMGRHFSSWMRVQAEKLAVLDLEAELEAAWRRVGG